MANFGGHAIPGVFFLLFGFWTTIKTILHHYWRTHQQKGKPLMPPAFKKMEYFEGGFAVFASFSGIMVEQFVVDGPHAHLYDTVNSSWVKQMNWQHSTMYMFYGIYGIAQVACTVSSLVPIGVNKLTLSLAFFVEGFLFYFHVHGRTLLDAHCHSLLLVSVFSAAAGSMLEVFIRNNIIVKLFNACMFILQGSWFFQIGLVLYPLSGPKWDETLHSNAMFITMCFCWHLAMAMLLVTSTCCMVWFIMRRFSGRRRDIEIGMRDTSNKNGSQKALLEESDEE
ncbi:transmembrane protein 45B [Antennarius striatus]|uniref:transmembrane protein 45B n=1 Tax=Antennarius striatus TaxID=241820 RepID=UPI0035B04D18